MKFATRLAERYLLAAIVGGSSAFAAISFIALAAIHEVAWPTSPFALVAISFGPFCIAGLATLAEVALRDRSEPAR